MEIDRIERIKKLQQQGYKVDKPHSLILNNIYALITIVTISLVVVIYTTYIQPIEQKKEQKLQQQALEKQKRKEYFEQRAKQIALSHKLNNIQIEKKDDNTTSK